MAEQRTNPIERIKAEKDGLDILDDIDELAARHGGWETLEPGDRERLKWIGTFFRKPTPGRFMMRLRITNGQLTSRQLSTLACLSQRLGNGVMDITTRQQLELRAIQIRDVPDILEALEGIDLTSLQTGMDNIRGVNTCALSGLTPHELFDAAPIGEQFTQTFLGNRAYTNLPRKLNVAITGCLENCTHSETQDIALTPAVSPEGAHGFNLAVGGKMGSGGMTVAQPLDVFIRPEAAASLAATVTLLFRDEGAREQRTKARLAFSSRTGALSASGGSWRNAGARRSFPPVGTSEFSAPRTTSASLRSGRRASTPWASASPRAGRTPTTWRSSPGSPRLSAEEPYASRPVRTRSS